MISWQIRMCCLAIFLLLCPFVVLAQDHGQASTTSVDQPDLVVDLEELIRTRLDPLGSCATPDGQQIAIRDMLFIENRDIPWAGADGETRARIQRQTLYIDHDHDSSLGVGTSRQIISEEIDPDAHLDLDLKFVLIDGTIGLYWRETFQHRMYRQGVFRFTAQQLTKVCEGEGGISFSHH